MTTESEDPKLNKAFAEPKPNDRLVAFLYILLRDQVTFGAVEAILYKHIEGRKEAHFEDKNLEAYVRSLAARLK